MAKHHSDVRVYSYNRKATSATFAIAPFRAWGNWEIKNGKCTMMCIREIPIPLV
jgi:hypothetical protein